MDPTSVGRLRQFRQARADATTAARDVTFAAHYRRLVRNGHGEPRLVPLKEIEAGDFVLTRERVDEMWRLLRLAEGEAHLATSTDRAIANAIHAGIDRAEAVVCVAGHFAADMLVSWLARFDEAVERFARVERLG